jgi:hypothetical protein
MQHLGNESEILSSPLSLSLDRQGRYLRVVMQTQQAKVRTTSPLSPVTSHPVSRRRRAATGADSDSARLRG